VPNEKAHFSLGNSRLNHRCFYISDTNISFMENFGFVCRMDKPQLWREAGVHINAIDLESLTMQLSR